MSVLPVLARIIRKTDKVPYLSPLQLYREAIDCLTQAGIANAKREAMWIVEESLGMSSMQIYAYGEDSLDSEHYQRAISLIKRRASREPLQYILGSQEFFGLDMLVGPGVLIPRPESELLVEEVIARVQSHSHPVVLDVGTGSGCLAISIVKSVENALVMASDRSVSALRIAKTNALKHGVASRILWFAGDLLAPLSSGRIAGKVTAIVANLPYISHDEWDRLSPEVKDFEPRLALDGGPDGLGVYRRLLEEAPRILASEGHLLMEIGIGQAEQLYEEVSNSQVFQVTKVQPDNQGIPRMVCLQFVGSS